VCSRSDVLAAACWGGFKASTGSSSIKIETSLSSEQEGESGCIQLSDDDPAIFSKLLHYLYVLEYDDYETENSQSESKSSILDSKEIVSAPSKLSNHASLYVMSDKYGVKGLKTIVGAKFNEALPLPIQLRDPSKLLPPFISAIDKIYTEIPSSNDPLRLDILCFLQGNIRRILHIEDFKNLLAKFPELSFALLEHAVRPLQDSAPSASEDVDKGSLVELMRARIARLEDNSDYA